MPHGAEKSLPAQGELIVYFRLLVTYCHGMSAALPVRPVPYLPALTGVRALAAFWVLLYHLHPALQDYFGADGLVLSFVRSGYQGVDLFFALSGFILAHHYAAALQPFDKKAYGHYLWARVARIYPLHLAMLFTVLTMVKLAPVFGFTINRATDYEWDTFFQNLFLVQAWQFPAQVNWNHFAWSISAEWFAYLLAPLFVAMAWRPQSLYIQLLLLIAFLCIAPVSFVLLEEPRPSAYALMRITGAFGAGMVSYRLFDEGQGARWNWGRGTWGAVAALVLAALLQDKVSGRVDFIVVPAAVLFIFALAHQQGSVAAVLGNRFFEYMGRLSYALYITQFILLMPLRKILPYQAFIDTPFYMQLAYLIGVTAAALFVACAAYHFIEEPARRALRRWMADK